MMRILLIVRFTEKFTVWLSVISMTGRTLFMSNRENQFMTMKFKVEYLLPKKKGYSKQQAVFYDVRDAMLWERHVKEQGCIDTEVLPVF